MGVGLNDGDDAGGHGGSVRRLWGEGGRAWAEGDCGGLNAPLDCCLLLLSPQEC